MRVGTLLFASGVLVTVSTAFVPSLSARTQDPCEDLFQATCLKDDGSRQAALELGKVIEEKIQFGREVAVRKLGFSTIEAAYLEAIKKSEFRLRPYLEEEPKQRIAAGEMPGELSDWFENFPKDCSEVVKLKQTNGVNVEYVRDELNRKKSDLNWLEYNLVEKQKQREATIVLRAKGPGVREEVLKENYDTMIEDQARQITTLQSELEMKKKEVANLQVMFEGHFKTTLAFANEKLQEYRSGVMLGLEKDPLQLMGGILELCNSTLPRTLNALPAGRAKAFPPECQKKSLSAIREAAVALYRAPDATGGVVRIREFVKKYVDTYWSLLQFYKQLKAAPAPKGPKEPKADDPFTKVLSVSQEVTEVCELYKTVSYKNLRNRHGKFLGQLSRSQPAVESILTSLYGPDLRGRVDGLFKQVHEAFLSFIDRELWRVPELKESPKFKKLRNGFLKLNYWWTYKPGSTVYKKEQDFALPVVDFERLPRAEMALYVFQDPSFLFFKEGLAFYDPALMVGTIRLEERLSLLPAINLLAKQDPYLVMQTLAHEMGHAIGPQVSKWNGYDLSNVYGKLVSCLSSGKSVFISGTQVDQTVADWVSAKVMGRMIMQSPETGRRKAALGLASYFCLGNAEGSYALDTEAGLRLNGLMGVNSDIRSSLGCRAASGLGYGECGLVGGAP